MEKAYDSLFLRHLLFTTATPSSSSATRNHHIPTRNVHPPMRDLALNRFKFAINPIRINNLSSPFRAAMTDANKKTTDQPEDLSFKANKTTEEEDKELDKVKKINVSPPPPPPPPEKPLPGDCCGSGCVRCVWDVYYEELDAYEKLHSS